MRTQKTLLPLKITLDVLMTLLLVLLYRKQVFGMSFHELGGLCLFGLFVVHHLLNLRWLTTATRLLPKKGTAPRLRVMWVLNLLLGCAFLAIIVTGLMIAKTLPFRLSGFSGAQQWHYFAAACALIFMGVHLGLHWPMLRGIAAKIPLPRPAVRVLGGLLLAAALCFGNYSLVTGSFARWLTGPFTAGAAVHQDFGGQGGDFQRPDFSGFAPGSDSGERPDFDFPDLPTEGGSDAPGTGNGFGKGQSRGAGHGEGNGLGNGSGLGQGKGMAASPLTAPLVAATYLSEILVFAFLTAAADFLLRRRKQTTSHPMLAE